MLSKRGMPPAFSEDSVADMQKCVSINDLSKKSGTRFDVNEMLVTQQLNNAAAICGGDLNDVTGTMVHQLSGSAMYRYSHRIAPVRVAVHDSNHATIILHLLLLCELPMVLLQVRANLAVGMTIIYKYMDKM